MGPVRRPWIPFAEVWGGGGGGDIIVRMGTQQQQSKIACSIPYLFAYKMRNYPSKLQQICSPVL